MRRKDARYPVFYDKEDRNPKALGICTYPRAFLLDKTGTVVWEGPLWKQNLPRIEQRVREILEGKSPPRFRIAYLSRKPDAQPVVFTVRLDGSDRRELGREPMSMTLRTVSPDGRRIVFASERDGNMEIYTMDLGSKRLRRLTANKVYDGFPVWSPDGRQIVFVSDRNGSREVHVMDADGANPRRLIRSNGAQVGPVWFTR